MLKKDVVLTIFDLKIKNWSFLTKMKVLHLYIQKYMNIKNL